MRPIDRGFRVCVTEIQDPLPRQLHEFSTEQRRVVPRLRVSERHNVLELQQTSNVGRIRDVLLELVQLFHVYVVVPPLQLLEQEEWEGNNGEPAPALNVVSRKGGEVQ